MFDDTSVSTILKNHCDKDERAGRSGGVGWQIWAVVASLPWLISTHSDPWTTFYSESLMAIALLPLLGWALYVSPGRWQVSRLVVLFASVALIPIVQAATGLLMLPWDAVLFVIYILAFAISVSLGQRVWSVGFCQLADSFFASLVIAALLSTGLALYQWLGLGGLGLLVPSSDIGGMRAIAQVGQSNNLSTLLIWGCVGLWWGYSRSQVGGLCVALALAFLLLGVTLTGSRTGCIQVVFVAVMALVWGRPRFPQYQRLVVIILVGWFVALLCVLPSISEWLFGALTREMLNVGVRPKFWLMAIDALVDRPLWGYGWNQVVLVHIASAEHYLGLNTVMGHAHNLLLDLLLWNGVVVGGLLIWGVVWWGWCQIRMLVVEAHVIILSALGVFFIHSMLELPHLYGFFILPVGLMVGMVSVFRSEEVVLTLSRSIVALIGVFFAILLAAMFHDYSLIQKDMTARRMVAARITGAVAPVGSEVFVLRSLKEALDRLHTKPHRGMSRDELNQLRRVVLRYPTVGGLFRYAQSAALNHEVGESKWALKLICDLNPPKVCEDVLGDWETLILMGNPEMEAVSDLDV